MAAIEIPASVGFRSKDFDLGYQQQNSPVGSGYIQTINRSTPTWYATYNTPPMTGDPYNAMRAFLDQLEGSIGTFLAYDPRRIMPWAYRKQSVSSDPWTRPTFVAPRITAQDYANSTITLDRMATGAIITTSDYISIFVGGIWYLFRATETKVADGTGVVAGLHVKPRPNMAAFAAANIRYRKACCEMKMLGKPKETDSVESFPAFQFNAAQFINRSVA